jgi:leader peptidase (prepilin peptidase)/N-methyltransferase
MLNSILVLLFGLIIGSFLNVVIHRLPRDESVVRPGSHCPGCEKPIRWYQNLPLLSYVLLRGKCSSCQCPIHWRYPLVEFLTAFLFWVSFRNLPIGLFEVISQFRLWFFIAISIAITFIDLDHRIIPDELSIGGWIVGALTAYWDFRIGMPELLLASIGGFGFFFIFGILYEKITGRVGLGGGDIKFMGTIGAFLGFGGLWSSILISSVVGSVAGLSIAHFRKEKEGLKMAIPYGPFLVLGALVELFFEVSKWIRA